MATDTVKKKHCAKCTTQPTSIADSSDFKPMTVEMTVSAILGHYIAWFNCTFSLEENIIL